MLINLVEFCAPRLPTLEVLRRERNLDSAKHEVNQLAAIIFRRLPPFSFILVSRKTLRLPSPLQAQKVAPDLVSLP
jgi:hypothetical protein